jgi:hypothetical protein
VVASDDERLSYRHGLRETAQIGVSVIFRQ